MSFGDAVKTCFQKYTTFTGRAGRPEFWWFVLLVVIANVVAVILDVSIGTQIFGLIVGLGLLLPEITVTVRRLHDTDRSGAWWFICLIPIVGGIALLVLCAMEGTQGANQYDEVATY